MQTTISISIKIAESSPKHVENDMGNGEIARHEQFLLSPQSFQKACNADRLKTRACLGEGKRRVGEYGHWAHRIDI